jgi:hypothetical protein
VNDFAIKGNFFPEFVDLSLAHIFNASNCENSCAGIRIPHSLFSRVYRFCSDCQYGEAGMIPIVPDVSKRSPMFIGDLVSECLYFEITVKSAFVMF